MTSEQHAKAIEDAAEQYAYAYSIDDFKDRSKAFDVLQDAIWAGVRVDHAVDANKMVAAPEGWQLVPIIPTEAMQEAGQENGADSHFAAWEIYRAMLGSAPKP